MVQCVRERLEGQESLLDKDILDGLETFAKGRKQQYDKAVCEYVSTSDDDDDASDGCTESMKRTAVSHVSQPLNGGCREEVWTQLALVQDDLQSRLDMIVKILDELSQDDSRGVMIHLRALYGQEMSDELRGRLRSRMEAFQERIAEIENESRSLAMEITHETDNVQRCRRASLRQQEPLREENISESILSTEEKEKALLKCISLLRDKVFALRKDALLAHGSIQMDLLHERVGFHHGH